MQFDKDKINEKVRYWTNPGTIVFQAFPVDRQEELKTIANLPLIHLFDLLWELLVRDEAMLEDDIVEILDIINKQIVKMSICVLALGYKQALENHGIE